MALMDDVTVPAQCAKCGHTVEKPVIWLKNNQPFPCAGCGQPVNVAGIDDMARSFEALNQAAAGGEVTIPKRGK